MASVVHEGQYGSGGFYVDVVSECSVYDLRPHMSMPWTRYVYLVPAIIASPSQACPCRVRSRSVANR